MSLSTTWGAHNRIVDEEISTTYDRERFVKTVAGVTCVFFKYTRVRTKRYRYLGMTEEAAISCANAMNKLYNRVCAEEMLHNPQNESVVWPWFDDGVHNGQTRPEEIAPRNDSLYAHKYVRRKVGVAVPSYSGESCAWNVTVTVNETLSAHFASTQRTGAATTWQAFEENPNGKFLQFIGLDYPEAEFYDDDEIGYGSPTGVIA